MKPEAGPGVESEQMCVTLPTSPPKVASGDDCVDVLNECLRRAESDALRWKKRFKRLLWFMVLGPFFGWAWVERFVTPFYLTPDEDSTQTLTRHDRHWFRRETVETITAHRTDYGTVEWMRKLPNGEWTQAFDWVERPNE